MTEYVAKQTSNLPVLCFDTKKSPFAGDSETPFNADVFVSECRARASLETLLRDLATYGSAVHAALLDALNTHFSAFNNLSTTLVQQSQRMAPVQQCLDELSGRIDTWLESLSRLEAEHTELLDRMSAISRKKILAQTLKSAITTTNKLEQTLAASPASADQERSAHLLSVVTWLCSGPLAGTPLASALQSRTQAARRELLQRTGAAFSRAQTAGDAEGLAACLRAYVALDATADARRTFSDTIFAPLLRRVAASALITPVDAGALHQFFAELEPFVSKDCALLARVTPEPHTLFLAAVLNDVDAMLNSRAPTVFSAALPAPFRACFTEASAFLQSLERACPSKSARTALRATPEYAQFQRRWNTKLYFQICSQDAAAPLELSITLTKRTQLLQSGANTPNTCGLRTTSVLLSTLRSCFTVAPPSGGSTKEDSSNTDVEGMFLGPVLQPATRLALQLLARYSGWIINGATSRYAGASASMPVSALSSSVASSSSSTSVNEEPWASFSVVDFLIPYHDCIIVERFCKEELPTLLKSCVAVAHPESEEQQQRVLEAMVNCFAEACTGLQEARSRCETMFVGTTAHLCCGGLKQMYGIMAAIRVSAPAASNGEVQPSHYVTGVMEPLSQLLERAAPLVDEDVRRGWARSVCDSVFSKGTEICGELVMTAYQTDDMLKRMTVGDSTGDAGGQADTSRFLAQLTADVTHLGKCAEKFGVPLATTPAYQRLCRCLKVM